jgi:hypothetical protein
LGERLLCKQEVVGSIPSGSTTSFDPLPVRAFARHAFAESSLPRAMFSRAAMPPADIFYIVKRGST